MANTSASSIISQAWDILKVDGSTGGLGLPGIEQAHMLLVLNRVNAEFIETPYEANQSAWPWMKAEYGITILADTTLAAAMTAGATTCTLTESADYATSGAGVIYSSGNFDIIEWTGNSADVLSGITGNGFAHSSGDGFSTLYALPSNFGRTRPGRRSGDGLLINGATYYYTGDQPKAWEFSIYDNGTTKYLWLPRGLSGTVSIAYDKQATTIDEASDTVDVLPKYDDFLIYRLVEHGKRVLQKNDSEIAEARNIADSVLRRALQSRVLGKRVTLVRGPMPEPVLLDGKYLYLP